MVDYGGTRVNTSADIRVMVVDDHPVVRFGLAAIINAQPDMTVVAQASTGAEAVELYPLHVPEVTLMDLRMPNMGGVEAIRAILAKYPNGRFIALTTYHGDEDIHQALVAGVKGYLLKGMSHIQLVQAIRDVHAGCRYLPDPVLETLAARHPQSELSARELQILRLIVKGQTNREIAEALGITEGTVKWHVNLILNRLQVHDRTQAAITAVQRGIVEL